jgi:hypothetical protein
MALDLENIAEIERRLAVREAREQRLEALAAKGLRRRATRSRIILGGAILAELRDNPEDRAFLDRIVAILDDRVSRDRDRSDLRDLLSVPVPSVVKQADSDGDDNELPDFASMAELAERVPRSIADTDPSFADVRHLLNPKA